MADRMSGPLSEPVARPRCMRAHAAQVVRQARIYADGRNLVVRGRRMRERRYPVGAAGIRRAVLIPPGDRWETVSRRSWERWGTLVLRTESGEDVLTLPLAEWLPEAGVVGAAEMKPAQCLRRTGLGELVTRLGLRLEESSPPSATGRAEGSGSRADRVILADLPRWHLWSRVLGVFGWFLALVVAFAAKASWVLPIAAGCLLLVPASDAILRTRAWWSNRRDLRPGGRFAESVVITPSPQAGSWATRRFLRTASLQVLCDEVVLTNTVGAERWLGRNGAHGVARLVRLVAGNSGQPLGVELRDGNGDTRALLPWRYWFAGPQGAQRWSDLVKALTVPVTDEQVGRAAQEEPSWRGHLYAADARSMSPLKVKDARRETSWNRSVIGGGELMLIPFFSAWLAILLFGDNALARVTGALAWLTIAAELAPAFAASLRSRFSYDKADESP
ncbi:hypothetical protein [Streptomyces sp. BK239]|uniref:hypothetical protein n=1 Tax=Streptomyces sp. BK239 TaxID=2512155 RepID=UPI00102B0495|nr:hypothetical protein [Streptomyces sp. BK239]RZU16929.1 hypothetical protein EV567_3361 [Streptomyces sp. BK239]